MAEKKLLREIIKEKYEALTEGQRIVAQYLTDFPEESAFKTASQIGMEVGVSESTVIRLSHSLGFDGFTQMQQVIRDEYVKAKSTVFKFQASTQYNAAENNLFANVLFRDIAILNHLIAETKEEDIWNIVDSIIRADQVVVVGHRYSYGPAYWFSFMLNVMLGKVSLFPSTNDVVESVLHLTENSLVIVISFPRYTKETLRYAAIAKEKGVKIVAITDKELSPAGRLADMILTTETNTLSGMDSITSTSALLNLVIAGVSSKHQAVIKKRLTALEKEYKRHEIFVDF